MQFDAPLTKEGNHYFIGRLEAIDPASDKGTTLHIWLQDQLYTFFTPSDVTQLIPGDIVGFTTNTPNKIDVITPLNHSLDKANKDLLRWRESRGSYSRMELLRQRHRLLRFVENWFDRQDFLQVALPSLVKFPNPEPHFNFIHADNGILSTSPELQMKRMLCGGFDKIVSIGNCFRGHEKSSLHNPEFTMVEWYRVGASLEQLANDLEQLWSLAAEKVATLNSNGTIIVNQHQIRIDTPPWPKISVRDVLFELLHIDISSCTESQDLWQRGFSAGLFDQSHCHESYEILFSRLWEKIEHQLGTTKPVFIVDWPAPLASLARLKPDNNTLCDRMELVIGGIEVANGFNELLDPVTHQTRFAEHDAVRNNKNLPRYQPDNTFLSAINAALPPCSGMALGFDRMCMLLTGANEIEDVLTFSWDEL